MQQLITEQILGYAVTVQPTGVCVRQICHWLESGEKGKTFICANPHSIVMAETDPLFQRAIQTADLLVPDGVGILLASKILGGRIQERVTGSDIFYGLSETLNSKSKGRFSYFFLGSTEENLAKIKDKMETDFPNIKFAGAYSPPFKPEFSEYDNRLIIKAINTAKPDVLWVGMTAPKQEKWIYKNKDNLDVKFIGAVGAVFDFYAGKVKRSHPTFQKLGLEWLPRLFREPGRLWCRNFMSNPKFVAKILAYKFGSKKINI
jgi:N-acetylglucosaminyldiphosphoundecaprenol N-acetyl-beta-D-mannosaminyltransferase